MVINIRTTDLELTDSIRSYVEEKMTSLEKFASDAMQIDVNVGKDTNHHNKGEIFSCSATLQLTHDVVRVERTAEDLYKAIDKVKDHLRETLAQRKDRILESRKAASDEL